MIQQVLPQLGTGAVQDVSTWQQVEQSIAAADPLLGLVLALFGLVALGAAMLAIINASSGRVLVQQADLGCCRPFGFTPGQVTAMLVAEHAALGLAGLVGGVAAAPLLAPRLLGAVPGVSPVAAALPWGWSLLIAVGVEVSVILATAIPPGGPAGLAGRDDPSGAAARPPVEARRGSDGCPAAQAIVLGPGPRSCAGSPR